MTKPEYSVRTLAIILTYHPSPGILQELCSAVLPQTDATLIVDNGSRWDNEALINAVDIEFKTRLQFLWLPENIGVAAGHNKGITWAREQGFTHILLLDQDSIPARDMVQQLHDALEQLGIHNTLIAGIGPSYIDSYTGTRSSFVRFGLISIRKIDNEQQEIGGIIETDFLISSGSLIPMKVFDHVGLMDEGLFIDHVDTEWVLRAKSRGYKIYGTYNAVMRHSLGNATLRFWFLRWRNVPLHSPERHYYIFRNSLVLFRRPYAPRQWIINDIVRLGYIAVFYPIFAPQRIKRITMILKGIWDGLHRVQGPLKNEPDNLVST